MDAAETHELDAGTERDAAKDADVAPGTDASKHTTKAMDAAVHMDEHPAASDMDGGPDPVVDEHNYPRWPMPDALAEAQTKPSYETRGDTVIDLVTHLEWQRTTPSVFDGCTGRYNDANSEGEICTWPEAEMYCKRYQLLVNQANWRLPTKIELETIVDETQKYPASDTISFTSPRPYPYWTGTAYPGAENNHYFVEFSVGTTAYGPGTSKAAVRCVR